MSREKIIKPLGLVTRPNKYGVYDAGGLSTCRNVCMRDKGVITSMPARQSYRANVLGAGFTIRRLFAGAASLLGIGDNAGTWQAEWITGAANTAITETPVGYASAPTFSVAKLHLAKARDRFFLTSDSSPLVLDSEGDTTTRAAGFPAPSIIPNLGTVANAVAFSAGNIACWCAVWRRKQSDGYEVISEPSVAIRIFNDSGVTLDMTFQWKIGVNGYDVIAGDYLDIYKTKQVATPSDPGLTFFLAQSHAVTAAEVAGGTVTVKDSTPDASLSEELYSNSGRPVPRIIGVGGSYVNTPPAVATDTWSYKGQTFYAISALASYFKFRIGTYWGALTTAAQRTTGIGTRTTNGTTAIGNNVITAVVDNTGVVIGQALVSAGVFPGGTVVTAVGAGTITVNQNATAAGVNAHTFEDVWEINGIRYLAGNGLDLIGALGFSIAGGVTLQADQSVYFGRLLAGPVIDTAAVTNGITFILRAPRAYNGAVTLRVTNAQNYAPTLAEITATAQTGDTDPRANRLQWSKPQQPEAVPPQQELVYGAGTHYRGIPAGDGVWLFASDGLRKKSGEQDEYRVDDRDLKLILAGRNAVAALRDTVYAYTNRGFVAVGADGSVKEIGADLIGDLIPGAAYADTWDTFVACDEERREVWLSFRAGGSTTSYVYSEVSGTFVDVVDGEWSTLEYAQYLRSLVLGFVDATPDVYRFELDTSLVRMGSAQLQFQPLTGGNENTLKQWQALDFIFEGVSAAPLSITPYFDGVAGAVPVASPIATLESRTVVGVPRSAAVANVLRPGFTLASGGTNNKWSFRGLSARYERLSEEAGRR
jgi:hypothetical protein